MAYRPIHASPSSHTPSSLASFDLHAPPSTDLWRLPPSATKPAVISNNAPSLIRVAKSFTSAQVTIRADWTRLYDQGGLVFYFPSFESGSDDLAWVKTGIEFYQGKPNLSTVATSSKSTSDWSLVPLQGTDSSRVTIRVERAMDGDAPVSSMWIYLIGPTGEKLPVREVTWAFLGEPVMEVGVYVARPTKLGDDDTEEVTVHFSDLEINAE